MNSEIGSIAMRQLEKSEAPSDINETMEAREVSNDIEKNNEKQIETPDIPYIEKTSRTSLLEQFSVKTTEIKDISSLYEYIETKSEGLTAEEKVKIKEETGWSYKIIENIKDMKQYEILKNAGLAELEINGRTCLIKENIYLDYADEDGVSNRDRIARGLAPLDSKTGEAIELHHLGQDADSPLVELTREEHRTGEYESGKKNQSLWHNNAVGTKVHGEGNAWSQEKITHWKERAEIIRSEGNG